MDTKNLTTDQLFKALPSFVNVKGDLYHFGLYKGGKRIAVEYRMNESEGGKALANTYRTGNTLKEVLKNTLEWLIEFGYYDLKSDNIILDMIKQSKK